MKLDSTIADNEQAIKELKEIGQAAARRYSEKVRVQEIKQKYRNEYMAGESFVGKMYARFTGSDKTYADMMYNINRG